LHQADGCAAKQHVELRCYQQECLERIEESASRGVRRQVAVWPTGSGKTVLFSELLRRKFSQRPGIRALVLAHRDELLEQARRKLLTVWPDCGPLLGTVRAEQDDSGARLVVASVQTLSRGPRLERYLEHGLPAVVVTDECHHAPAPSYMRIYDRLSVLPDQDIGDRLHLGVTATPDRADGVGLKCVFDEVVHVLTVGYLIELGFLVPVRGLLVRVDVDLDGVPLKPGGGDFADSGLAKVMGTAEVVEAIARAWVEKGEGRQTIAFTPSVSMAHMLAEALRAHGVAAEALSSASGSLERRRVLERFEKGDIRVLCNCQLLTEGFDVPEVSCILMARPTKSRALYQQCVGRGLRPAPWAGKADCLVLDVVGNSLKHKLVTVATLSGKEPAEEEEAGRGSGAPPAPDGKAEAEGSIALYRGPEKVVGLITGFGWVKLSDDVLALHAASCNAVILVRRSGGKWQAVLKDFEREGSAGWELLAEGPDRGYVFGIAEALAAKLGDPTLLRSDAAWRELPPTEAQVFYVTNEASRRGLKVRLPATRGEAADIITCWKLQNLLSPPTEKQRELLEALGAWDPMLTKKEAQVRIARLLAQKKTG